MLFRSATISYYDIFFDDRLALRRMAGSPVTVINRRPGARYNVTVVAKAVTIQQSTAAA